MLSGRGKSEGYGGKCFGTSLLSRPRHNLCMDIIWMIGIWSLFLWYAIIIGTTPVILVYRIRALWRERGNDEFAMRDHISLALFDVGIIGVTGWLLYITIQYVQLGQFGLHDWNNLLLVHLWSACFAIALIIRTALWRTSWGLKDRK
jgi:hypothetical protein